MRLFVNINPCYCLASLSFSFLDSEIINSGWTFHFVFELCFVNEKYFGSHKSHKGTSTVPHKMHTAYLHTKFGAMRLKTKTEWKQKYNSHTPKTCFHFFRLTTLMQFSYNKLQANEEKSEQKYIKKEHKIQTTY